MQAGVGIRQQTFKKPQPYTRIAESALSQPRSAYRIGLSLKKTTPFIFAQSLQKNGRL